MPETVSVLIPTYNRKELLKKALESVLSQDYPHLEVVISDNASTDGTEEFVKGCNDSRIKYIKRPENIGAGRNFQEGFKDCTGKYFFCLNDDDWLTNRGYFSRAVSVMEENPNVSIVRGVVVVRDHKMNKNQIQEFNTSDVINGLEYFQHYATEGYENFICWFGFVRREQIEQAGGLHNHYSADTFMNLTACLYGDVYFLPEIIGQYNLWGKNQASFNSNVLKDVIEIPYIMDKMAQLAIKIHPQFEGEIKNRFRNTVITCISWTVSLFMQMKKSKELKKILEESNLKRDYPALYKEIKRYTSPIFEYLGIKGFSPYAGPQYNIKKSFKIFGKSIIRKIINPRG